MKKLILISGILVIAVAALAFAGFAYAQSQNPDAPAVPYGPGMMGGRGYGYGMMGRGAINGGGMMNGQRGTGAYGPVHTYMVDALAESLNLTPEAVQERMDNGETAWEIAASTGLSDEEVTALLQQVHTDALAAAVEAGAITQEQADWMQSHMQQMWQNGGPGGCHGAGNSGRGYGPGMRWNTQPQSNS